MLLSLAGACARLSLAKRMSFIVALTSLPVNPPKANRLDRSALVLNSSYFDSIDQIGHLHSIWLTKWHLYCSGKHALLHNCFNAVSTIKMDGMTYPSENCSVLQNLEQIERAGRAKDKTLLYERAGQHCMKSYMAVDNISLKDFLLFSEITFLRWPFKVFVALQKGLSILDPVTTNFVLQNKPICIS